MTINIILIILFFIGESEKDIIMTNPKLSFFPNWDYYNRHNYTGTSWLIKNVFSWIADGFHFWKAISILIPSYFTTEILDISIYYTILFFAVSGLYHSLRVKSIFRKGLK